MNQDKINLQREEVIEKITQWLKEEGHTVELGSHPKAYYFGIVKFYDKKPETPEEFDQTHFDVITLHTLIFLRTVKIEY